METAIITFAKFMAVAEEMLRSKTDSSYSKAADLMAKNGMNYDRNIWVLTFIASHLAMAELLATAWRKLSLSSVFEATVQANENMVKASDETDSGKAGNASNSSQAGNASNSSQANASQAKTSPANGK